MLMVAGFGGLTALGLGVIGQYLRLSLQNARNRPTFVVQSTQAFVHRESAAAEEKVMKKPPQTDGTESPANLAVNTQIPSPETQRPAKPDLSSVVPGLHTTLQRAYPFILIVSVAWLANFLHFTSFGHYEDDWYCFPAAFGQPLSARIKVLLSMIKSLFQGRPVPLVHETVFSYVGKLFSSISLPYVLAFLMLSAFRYRPAFLPSPPSALSPAVLYACLGLVCPVTSYHRPLGPDDRTHDGADSQ